MISRRRFLQAGGIGALTDSPCRHEGVVITGDATVSMLVARSIGKLGEPHVKTRDDATLAV